MLMLLEFPPLIVRVVVRQRDDLAPLLRDGLTLHLVSAGLTLCRYIEVAFTVDWQSGVPMLLASGVTLDHLL